MSCKLVNGLDEYKLLGVNLPWRTDGDGGELDIFHGVGEGLYACQNGLLTPIHYRLWKQNINDILIIIEMVVYIRWLNIRYNYSTLETLNQIGCHFSVLCTLFEFVTDEVTSLSGEKWDCCEKR